MCVHVCMQYMCPGHKSNLYHGMEHLVLLANGLMALYRWVVM